MDSRLKDLAERLDAGLIARREFLRKAALVTGGTAVGLKALESMARAQSPTKLRVWLFKSYVTAGNDILAKQVEAWAKERNVEPEFDWATFGDREQKFVAAIEAGNPPDVAEMNYQGPMRYKAALRDVTKLAKDLLAVASCRTRIGSSSSTASTSASRAWPSAEGSTSARTSSRRRASRCRKSTTPT